MMDIPQKLLPQVTLQALSSKFELLLLYSPKFLEVVSQSYNQDYLKVFALNILN
jgi:hypothetical protein